ncbi:DUF2225 domain-containing protein [Paenibacillus sp.]|uniref:DUF2225 domain-containing protein n=1 Tax=Paenibacillus sp. TaxID=58172 RepID=UPI002D2AD8F1|nr:DUF2225 domain-containing protein [Paenibacillus sp.]HZG57604.1 DUF2225 domain-containing protein [Paenibacillus sp.]
MEPLYRTAVACLCCQRDFQTSRVRPSFKKPVKTDTDFCTYFKEGNENPEFYVVRVCPYCGFASTENFAASLTERQRAAVRDKISSTWQMRDFGNSRTIAEAMHTYKLALLSAQAIGERPRVVAGILHHIAWLYRYQGDQENEQRFLRFALQEYIRVYETEGLEVNNARLMFLIGELHRRLKEFSDAVKWFSRVINDKRITDAGMIRACRDGWATVREEMLEAKLELPEEMQTKQSAGKK